MNDREHERLIGLLAAFDEADSEADAVAAGTIVQKAVESIELDQETINALYGLALDLVEGPALPPECEAAQVVFDFAAERGTWILDEETAAHVESCEACTFTWHQMRETPRDPVLVAIEEDAKRYVEERIVAFQQMQEATSTELDALVGTRRQRARDEEGKEIPPPEQLGRVEVDEDRGVKAVIVAIDVGDEQFRVEILIRDLVTEEYAPVSGLQARVGSEQIEVDESLPNRWGIDRPLTRDELKALQITYRLAPV